ncbi:MAG: EthD domain-containing protein [Alphaproteobacteria bacterium]
MLKVFGFVRRNADLTHDEYRTAHVGYHNSYGRRLPNIRGYLLNVWANRPLDESLGALAETMTRGEPNAFNEEWDGWGQLMFDSLEDYLSAKSPSRDRAGPGGLVDDPLVGEVGGDGDYLYSGSPFQFHTIEHVAVPVTRPERKLFKLVQFGKRAEGISEEEFRATWTGRYAALWSEVRGLRGHIVNFRTDLDVMTGFFPPTAEAFTVEGKERRDHFFSHWDGMAELWFDRPDQLITARHGTALGNKLAGIEDELFNAVFYREVDETVAVNPNRAPAPDFYYR